MAATARGDCRPQANKRVIDDVTCEPLPSYRRLPVLPARFVLPPVKVSAPVADMPCEYRPVNGIYAALFFKESGADRIDVIDGKRSAGSEKDL